MATQFIISRPMSEMHSPDAMVRVKRILKRFEFRSPIPIVFDAEWNSRGIVIVVSLLTTNSGESSYCPITVNVKKTIDNQRLQYLDTPEVFESYIKEDVRDLVRRIWIHEMCEWFKFDGERITEPHTVDHDDRDL